ncbi:hypothetical protein [Corynebacterium flavescens]|uniref:hypothetical protein n=1 Tax=Corynebacterium flavescens TaxID=28028 RepID=UPI0023F44E6C
MSDTYLITGAGSGFSKEIALRLAEQGHDVIAGVEIIAQVNTLRAEAHERGVELRVENLMSPTKATVAKHCPGTSTSY